MRFVAPISDGMLKSKLRNSSISYITVLGMTPSSTDQLVSLGVKHPVRVMQAGAVGTAALVGLVAARNKSLFRKVLYPLLAGSTTWGVVHFSDYKNRMKVSEIARKEFSKNFNKEFSKHFPQEYWKHLPEEMKEEMKKHRQPERKDD